jgi:hypothetical protein
MNTDAAIRPILSAERGSSRAHVFKRVGVACQESLAVVVGLEPAC